MALHRLARAVWQRPALVEQSAVVAPLPCAFSRPYLLHRLFSDEANKTETEAAQTASSAAPLDTPRCARMYTSTTELVQGLDVETHKIFELISSHVPARP
jgi:hypothetical protein